MHSSVHSTRLEVSRSKSRTELIWKGISTLSGNAQMANVLREQSGSKLKSWILVFLQTRPRCGLRLYVLGVLANDGSCHQSSHKAQCGEDDYMRVAAMFGEFPRNLHSAEMRHEWRSRRREWRGRCGSTKCRHLRELRISQHE